MEETKKITAFVTYAWDTKEFNDKVLELVAFLRRNGIDAACDQTIMEDRTDPNFNQVMHEGLARDKVIVVLSKKYKEKTNYESTGVNKEYSVIATQRSFENHRNKFIFVSLQGITQNDIEEIVPTMYSGIEILDLSKKDESMINRLFAKLRGEKIIKMPPVADEMPDIKTKIYTGDGEKKDRYIFSFQISEDCETMTYTAATRNSLRKWMGFGTGEFEIEIENLYINSLQRWCEIKDLDIDKGNSLSEEDEKNYILISQTIKSFRGKDIIAKIALQTFLEKLFPEISAFTLTVDDSLKIIEKIFAEIYLLKNRNTPANVEGWCIGARNDFSFKAKVEDVDYGELTKDMLYFGDARIEDFSKEDIIGGIVPAICTYFAFGKVQNKEYIIEKKKNWLHLLQFGLA
ncbi:MAG: TIR domain-containing protein [Oscillibacter sp.]|nr:TIR domain-containing protein [Oscillibacter sp.]